MLLGAVVTSLMLIAGFVVFAATAARQPSDWPRRADAVVVLTGGAERRIEAGLQLLARGHGQRLLISGVNRRSSPGEVLAQAGASLAACCIDLGYEALDTIGNALEARSWAAQHGFRRLIVVTSSYHMPRSLNELAMAMPDVELVAHPLVPRVLRDGPWWLSASAARMLAVEYLKLVPSYGRRALHRALLSSGTSARPVPGNGSL